VSVDITNLKEKKKKKKRNNDLADLPSHDSRFMEKERTRQTIPVMSSTVRGYS